MALRFLFTAAALGLEASRVLWEQAALIAVTPVSPFPALLGARRAAGRRDGEGMTASLHSVGSPPRRGDPQGPLLALAASSPRRAAVCLLRVSSSRAFGILFYGS